MNDVILQTRLLDSFECLGNECDDTCCKGWGMQLDEETYQRYKQQAPELLDAVTSGEAKYIMKRDATTDYCVKFDNGWCAIHKQYGTEFLGDACHFFPRVTRKIGDKIIQTASMSCPEIARRVLFNSNNFTNYETQCTRIPFSIRDYLPTEITSSQALQIHDAFLQAANDKTSSAEHIICRMLTVAESMKAIAVKNWPEAVAFYFRTADNMLPPAETNAADPFNCLHALVGLLKATRKSPARQRLDTVITTMQKALMVEFDSDNKMSLSADSSNNYQQICTMWQEEEIKWQPALRRWLQSQLSVAFIPFAGLGNDLPEKIVIIAVRLASLKLALMSYLFIHEKLTDDDAILIVQSLARFMDHLADPTLSLQIYEETGWMRAGRLRGLLGDV